MTYVETVSSGRILMRVRPQEPGGAAGTAH